jgi:hypothetical protein
MKAVAVEGETDCPRGESGVEEGVDYRKDAENGEGHADVGYYIGCVCHFLFFSFFSSNLLLSFLFVAGSLLAGKKEMRRGGGGGESPRMNEWEWFCKFVLDLVGRGIYSCEKRRI